MNKIFIFLLFVMAINVSAKKDAGVYYFEFERYSTSFTPETGIDVVMIYHKYHQEVFSGAKARNISIAYEIKNLTSEPFYIDLSRCYYIRNEETISYYHQNYTTESKILLLQPYSSVTLSPIPLFELDSNTFDNIIYTKSYNSRGTLENNGDVYGFINDTHSVIGNMKVGEIQQYTIDCSPIRFALYLTYSTNRDFSGIRQGYVKFYVNKIIAAKRVFKGLIRGKEISKKWMDKSYPGWDSKLYFLMDKNR